MVVDQFIAQAAPNYLVCRLYLLAKFLLSH